MACIRIGILVLVVALGPIYFSGCSNDPAAPEDTAEPSLNSGYSNAEWWIEGATCDGGNYCLDYVGVSKYRGDSPELSVRVSGDSGSISQTTIISIEDFDAFREFAGAVVSSRQGESEGCIPVEGLYERVGVFAGDAGWAVGIEGCDDPAVQQARDFAVDLVEMYCTKD